MEILDYTNMTIPDEDRPVDGSPIEPANFGLYEPTVSQVILRRISNVTIPSPQGMRIVAMVTTTMPEACRVHYGDGLYAEADGTKRMIGNNHLQIWLCRGEFFALKLADMFHTSTAGEKQEPDLDAFMRKRMLVNLAHKKQGLVGKIGEKEAELREIVAHHDTVLVPMIQILNPPPLRG